MNRMLLIGLLAVSSLSVAAVGRLKSTSPAPAATPACQEVCPDMGTKECPVTCSPEQLPAWLRAAPLPGEGC